MKLPADPVRRHALYRDIIRSCEMPDRVTRRERFRRMRTLELVGAETGDRAHFNALREWTNLSTSLMYAPSNIQFGLAYPPYYGDIWDEELAIAKEELHRLWYDPDAETPLVIQAAIAQAHFADTAIVKLHHTRNRPTVTLIADPSDVCVLDDHVGWAQQEAFVHWYTVNVSAFGRMLDAVPDLPDRDKMWDAAQDYALPAASTDAAMPATVQRLIISAITPTVQGNVQGPQDTALALPRSRTPVVPIAELWIWDDQARELCKACHERKGFWRHHWDTNKGGHPFTPSGEYIPDWRVVTQFVPTLDILWEPINPLGIEGHAFFPLTLDPDSSHAMGYIWGVAPMEQLIAQQMWAERKLGELDLRDELDINPPLAIYGVPSRDGETTKTWRKPGGDIPLNMPNAKVEPIRPTPLPDKFEFVREIYSMMRQSQGIPKAMAGQNEAGIRSGEQAVALALLGAGPTMNRAMVVENVVGAIATAMMRMHRNVLGRPLVKANGESFLLRQMPGDFTARVWAHSASPIYTEQIKEIALILHAKGAITDEALLEYCNLPGTSRLLRDSKKLQEIKAQLASKEVEAKQAEVQAKVTTADAKMLQAKMP